MRWLSHLILRRAGLVATLGTILALMGGYYSALLYKNLRTDIHELLPTEARSVTDLSEVSRRLQAIENLDVLVLSADPNAGKRFVQDLVQKLEKLPKTIIAGLEYKIDEEILFFKQRQALYIDLSDLSQIKNYIRSRIDYEKELYNPLRIFQEEDLKEPYFDFENLRKKYTGQTSSFDRYPEGHYATSDGTKRVLLVYISGESFNSTGMHRLKSAVETAVKELNPKSYAPHLEVKYTGGVQDGIEEQEALVEDLEISTIIVTAIVTLGMLFYYRAVRATLALVVSLFVGTFWTFGLSYFIVGYLNANSAFLGSIVIGNGINFGIIYLARYLEERRKGKSDPHANQIAMRKTATSTATAALAAGLSYGSLMLTSFRGFNQFGVIGLMGMVLCWISAYTLLPAYLTLLERFGPPLLRKRTQPKAWFSNALASFIGRYPKWIWRISLGITAISLLSLLRLNSNILETDLNKLRNRESFTQGSAFLAKYTDEIFQHSLSPLIILPKTRENAQKIAQALKQRQKEEGESSQIASVKTLDDFIPSYQEEKIETLRQIRSLLPERLIRRLSLFDQRLVSEFLSEVALQPLKEVDLPHLVLNKFTEKDGTIGKLIAVEPPLHHQLTHGQNLIRFIDSLRNIADSVEPGVAIAGSNAVSSDMLRAITQDGPKATLFAFLAVVALVIVLFREPKIVSLILVALFLGLLWMFGVILGFKLKINFLNFIALPITFGIGVDYAVNIFQRYQEEKGKNILGIIQSTGGAVGLCSFSTMVGYASLLIARNQGFVSFGILAVAGELTCVLAAVVALPAFLLLRQRALQQRAGN